jgi:hypothetical protein
MDGHSTTVQFHDFTDQGESKARARHVGILNTGNAVKLLENVRQDVRRNTVTVIAYLDQQTRALIARRDGDLSFGGAVFDRISYQVGQRLGDQVAVS